MDRFRRGAAVAAAATAVITLAVDSRWLVPLLIDRSGDPSAPAKVIAVLWQVGIALLLVLNPKKGAASAAALASLAGWFALAPTGAGALIFRHFGGIDATQTALLVVSLTLQIAVMIGAVVSRLLDNAAPSPMAPAVAPSTRP